jgi:hypothetical protein
MPSVGLESDQTQGKVRILRRRPFRGYLSVAAGRALPSPSDGKQARSPRIGRSPTLNVGEVVGNS